MPEKEKKSYIDSSHNLAKSLQTRNDWFNGRTGAASVVLRIFVASLWGDFWDSKATEISSDSKQKKMSFWEDFGFIYMF